MINGFRLKITAAELRLHCKDRATYHRELAAEASAQIPDMAAAIDRVRGKGRKPTSVSTMNKSGYRPDNPVEDLEDDVRDHENKALVFDFYASHLFDEDYDLPVDDLVRLEMLKR